MSFVINVVGGFPDGAEIVGFEPFSPLTVGRFVDESDTVEPPQALRISAATERDTARSAVVETRRC